MEELDRAEVDLLVERVHGRDDLVVDAQPVVGLAEFEFDVERAEEGRVCGASARVPVVPVHHVVVDRGQRVFLVAVPERLGVGDDALVGDGVPVGHCGDPSRRDAHLLVVLEAVEVGTQHPHGLERVLKEGAAVGRGGPDAVDRPAFHHFEADPVEREPQVLSQNLVDGEDLVQPPERRVNGLLWPVDRRIVAEKLDRDLADLLPGEPGGDPLGQPEEALLEGGQDFDRRGVGVGAGGDQAAQGLLLDRAADIGGLGQAGVEVRGFSLGDPGGDALLEDRPETVDLRRHGEGLVEDSGGVLHVAVVDRYGDLVGAQGGGPLTHEVGKPVGGLLE